jgi:hypothetical protein
MSKRSKHAAPSPEGLAGISHLHTPPQHAGSFAKSWRIASAPSTACCECCGGGEEVVMVVCGWWKRRRKRSAEVSTAKTLVRL